MSLLLLGFILFLVACKTSKNVVSGTNETKATDTTVTTVYIDSTKQIEFRNTTTERTKELTTRDYYDNAFEELQQMLDASKPLNFKRAVFLTENAYFKDSLDYDKFKLQIRSLAEICMIWMKSNKLIDYNQSDSLIIQRNGSIFTLMKDTVFLVDKFPFHIPFQYDFNDFLGEQNWSNQFVTKLLTTDLGNCHSLPYLYKILADELNAEAYLSLAPNHIYVKHRSKEWGWYNTELTSGEFPTDAWVKASGYITIDAIRNGIYMDTLGQKESVALCVYDLAKGYFAQTGNYMDGFVINCCDLVLKHHPTNINAVILKAETLRKQYGNFKKNGQQEKAQKAYSEMQQLYVKGLEMGYREMPKEMYLAWLSSINEQKDKYVNSKINRTFKTK
ncbi:MAG: hypothetical protein WC994_11270 [Brumimicrobium sp.]